MEFRKIEVVPISGNIGALINGAQLNALNDETFEEVYQAWLDHCVIFFRDQKITPREQIDFAQRFGEIHFHPYMKGLDDHPEFLEIIKEPGDGYTLARSGILIRCSIRSLQKLPCFTPMKSQKREVILCFPINILPMRPYQSP